MVTPSFGALLIHELWAVICIFIRNDNDAIIFAQQRYIKREKKGRLKGLSGIIVIPGGRYPLGYSNASC